MSPGAPPSWTGDPESRLSALLDAGGVRYRLDRSGGNVAAHFGLHVPPGVFAPYGIDARPAVDRLLVIAQLLGPVLRLSARIAPRPPTSSDYRVAEQINRTWLSGWASADGDGLAVHLSLYVRDEPRAAAALVQASAVLRDVGSYLAAAAPQGRPGDDLVHVLIAADGVFDEVAGAGASTDIEAVLRRLGVACVRAPHDRCAVPLRVADGREFVVEIGTHESRFLQLFAVPSASGGAPAAGVSLAAMQRLNARLHAGALVATAAGVCYRAAFPLASLSTIDDDLVSWLLDHAAAVMEQIGTAEARSSVDEGTP